jgi:hypothetical protein
VTYPEASEYDPTEERRHGLWGLAVLVMVAIIVVAFVLLLSGGGASHNGTAGQDDSTLSGALPSGSHGGSRPAGRSSTPAAIRTSLPARACHGSGPCPVNGDVAGVAAGINALRIAHGLAAVPARASVNAQDCAAAHGNGPSCIPHYMYAKVGGTTAASAVQALEHVNAAWLLDPSITRFEIGFARELDGGYDCAVLKYTS